MAQEIVKSFTTDDLLVRWAHLHQPDTFFGVPGDHNITVVISEDMSKELIKLQSTTGAKKINGTGTTDDGVDTLKVKSKVYTQKGERTFPCVGADAKNTEDTPFQGDTVRLILNPRVNDRDGSLSIWLSGCQIVKSEGKTTGFTPVEGEEVEDLPF
jgi:hypothetical protein